MTIQIQAKHPLLNETFQKRQTSPYLTLSIGLAMFSMFFGAGNIIYPLAIGQYAGDQNAFAIFGLLLTAAMMPMAGVMAMVLFNGNYRDFFGRLGRFPGFILSFAMIALLGPLGSTPRCIALSYTTLQNSFTHLHPVVFSAGACSLIFLCAVKKRRLIQLLGCVLTPLLLLSLIVIIGLGYTTASAASHVEIEKWNLFLHGLKEGYNTMDLLAAFFFSSTILSVLKMQEEGTRPLEKSEHIKITFQASLIGAFLLAAIYIGFSYIASFHAHSLLSLEKDQLLSVITLKIAGPYAGILVCVTIAFACLTTAIALISSFTDFVQTEVLKNRLSYELTLALGLILTFFISTFNFHQISAFLWPILQVCYPGLIALTCLNLAHHLWGIQTVKLPVFLVFGFSAYFYFFI